MSQWTHLLLPLSLLLYAILRKSQALCGKFTSPTSVARPVFVQPLRHACGVPPPLPRGGFGSPRKVNGFARGSPTRGAVERSETERLYEGEPFLCRKVRLLASPVSFWRNVCYNGFAVHPAYLTGEEVDALAYFLTFLVSVGADVVSHFICKWLDRCEENRKA